MLRMTRRISSGVTTTRSRLGVSSGSSRSRSLPDGRRSSGALKPISPSAVQAYWRCMRTAGIHAVVEVDSLQTVEPVARSELLQHAVGSPAIAMARPVGTSGTPPAWLSAPTRRDDGHGSSGVPPICAAFPRHRLHRAAWWSDAAATKALVQPRRRSQRWQTRTASRQAFAGMLSWPCTTDAASHSIRQECSAQHHLGSIARLLLSGGGFSVCKGVHRIHSMPCSGAQATKGRDVFQVDKRPTTRHLPLRDEKKLERVGVVGGVPSLP